MAGINAKPMGGPVSDLFCDDPDGRRVMILDNADDLDVFLHRVDGTNRSGDHRSAPATNDVPDILPQSPNGSILITS